MTPLERAEACGHPSTYQSAAHIRRELAGDPDAAASGSTPSPWSVCADTVSSLNDAVNRLRVLRGDRDE